jgi:hypothetical protein
MSYLRIHNIDKDLKDIIKNSAKLKHTTPNELVLSLLHRVFEADLGDGHDFSDFSYTMKDSEKFEEVSLDLQKIDIEMWQ